MAKCFPQFGHNYNQVSREVMYNWFNKHLKLGLPGPVHEKPFVPVPPKELSVYDDRAPAAGGRGRRRRRQESADRAVAEADGGMAPKDAAKLAEFRRVVGTALRVMIHDVLPAADEVEVTRSAGGGAGRPIPASFCCAARARTRRSRRTASAGRSTTARSSSGSTRGARRACSRTASSSPRRRPILDRKAAILAADVFGTGELAAKPAVNAKYAGYTFGYNRPLVAERVHDILTAVAFAKGHPKPKRSTWSAGSGRAVGDAGAAWAATRSPRTAADLDGFRFETCKTTDDPMMLPGALKYGGLPAFAALCAPGELLLHNHRGTGTGRLVADAYRAAGADGKLRREPGRLAGEKWWSGCCGRAGRCRSQYRRGRLRCQRHLLWSTAASRGLARRRYRSCVHRKASEHLRPGDIRCRREARRMADSTRVPVAQPRAPPHRRRAVRARPPGRHHRQLRLRHPTAAHLLQARPGQPHLPPGAAPDPEGQVQEQPARRPVRLPHHPSRGPSSRPPSGPRLPQGARVRRAGPDPQPVGPRHPDGHGRGGRRPGPARPRHLHPRPGPQKDPRTPPSTAPSPGCSRSGATSPRRSSCGRLVQGRSPGDVEAPHKAKDLAASETIQRGQYDEAVAERVAVDAGRTGGRRLPPPTTAPPANSASLKAADRGRPDPARRRTCNSPPCTASSGGRSRRSTVLHRASARPATTSRSRSRSPTWRWSRSARTSALTEQQAQGRARTTRSCGRSASGCSRRSTPGRLELLRLKSDRSRAIWASASTWACACCGPARRTRRSASCSRPARTRGCWARRRCTSGFCFKSRNNWRLAERNFQRGAQDTCRRAEDASRKEVMFQLGDRRRRSRRPAQAVDLGHELANLDYLYRDIGRLLDEWQAKLQKA